MATQFANVSRDFLKIVRLLPSPHMLEAVRDVLGTVASRENEGLSDTHEFVRDRNGRTSAQIEIEHGDIETIVPDSHRVGEFGNRSDHMSVERPESVREVVSDKILVLDN
ncbi:hypothetical protein [Bradyrhizobium sp. UFLA05-112]